MSSYAMVFGGSAVKSADPQYLALTFAADTSLVWPLETVAGATSIADQIDATASAGGLVLTMPPANQGSKGVVTMVTNIGSNSFAIEDNSGNNIVTIAASQTYIISLTDNTTVAGLWRAYQLAATTSSANAGALAGLGLEAASTQLQTTILSRAVGTSGNLITTDRAKNVRWTGAVGTLTLAASGSSLTSGWWSVVTNAGTDTVTVNTTGADTINGIASIELPASTASNQYYSALIVSTGTGFTTALTGGPVIIPVAGGGTGADNALDALGNLGGSTVGISVFTIPSLAALQALLGIIPVTILESTISTDQTLTNGSSATGFVCTAALTLTLPVSTTLTTAYFFLVMAQGGAVTVTPSGGESINGAASSMVIPTGSSILMQTDAAGNWWPVIYASTPSLIPVTVVTAGITYACTASDVVVVINKTVGAAITVTLPASPASGRRVKIKDGKGDAATNNITVVPSAGTIDGAANYVLAFAYEAEEFVYNGSQWNCA